MKRGMRNAECGMAALLLGALVAGCIATSDVQIQERRREEAREQSAVSPKSEVQSPKSTEERVTLPPALAGLKELAQSRPALVVPPKTVTYHLSFWWEWGCSTNRFGIATPIKDGRWATQYCTVQASLDLKGSEWVDLVTTNRTPVRLDSTNQYAFYRYRMDIR